MTAPETSSSSVPAADGRVVAATVDHGPPVDRRRRRAIHREVAARYDGAHAFLVRVVHPLCFSAFAITALVVAGGATYAIIGGSGGDEILGVLVGMLAVLAAAVAAAFTFVITPGRAVFGLLLLAGWTVALVMVDEVPEELLWTLWIVALLSIVLQVVLLARAAPDRWHNGLMHLLVPATFGTIVGAAPIVLGLGVLASGDRELALQLTQAAFISGCGVLVALLVLHLFGNRGDQAVLTEFAQRRGMTGSWTATPTPAGAAPEIDTNGSATEPRMVARLVNRFANHSGPWYGTANDREIAVITGYSSTAAPDVPSVHLTVLGIRVASGGRDVWVRRSSWVHDNVLASLGRSEVVEFESISLSEEYDVRFPAGTGEITAFTTFGPQVVDLLASGLDDAQVCRIGDAVLVFVVGGVLSASELDRMLETGCAFAELLEKAEAAEQRSPDA